ncbi:sensor histidine kinase [Ochrobactrum pseudogrignonense]|nr:sensor histidine kinase [Brucella pseudogrignonensis]
MKHRIKNVLATVQALARQTFRNPAHKSAYQTFEARLGAMARTHDLLTADVWQATELNKLVEEALLPFGLANFSIKGPKIEVSSRAAMAFPGLHELATNASKYGALSVPAALLKSHGPTIKRCSSSILSGTKRRPQRLSPQRQGFRQQTHRARACRRNQRSRQTDLSRARFALSAQHQDRKSQAARISHTHFARRYPTSTRSTSTAQFHNLTLPSRLEMRADWVYASAWRPSFTPASRSLFRKRL